LTSPLKDGSLKPCREKKKETDRPKIRNFYYKVDSVSRNTMLFDVEYDSHGKVAPWHLFYPALEIWILSSPLWKRGARRDLKI
jgi:hypothetical protein